MASDLAVGVPERDLIPGDPDEIEVLVSRLFTFATGMIEASDRLRDIQAGEWKGQAGDAFRLLVGDQPAHYERAGSAFAEASRTTAQYAEVLREAQFDARRAVALYEQAEAETKDWKRRWDAHDAEVRAASRAGSDGPTFPRPPHADPGAGDRAIAHRLLEEARERVDTQARLTARVLQQAEEAAPKKPGLLDSIFGGIGDFYKTTSADFGTPLSGGSGTLSRPSLMTRGSGSKTSGAISTIRSLFGTGTPSKKVGSSSARTWSPGTSGRRTRHELSAWSRAMSLSSLPAGAWEDWRQRASSVY